MNLKDLIQDNLKLDSSIICFDESMKIHTSFKIGGNAECFIKVKSEDDLRQILKFGNENELQLTIIGNGSNLLVLDGGIKGLVLKIEIKKLEIKRLGDLFEVIVGAGNNNTEISQVLLKNEITGYEEISGIPGTIGGAIRMNAGAYGKEMKDIVKSVKVMDYNGNVKELSNEELEFEYRNSILSREKYIVLETVLELREGKYDLIKEKMMEYLEARKEKQPLDKPNAGSTFKRGTDFITAKIIDEVGLKGFKLGGAMVSNKHAGFVVNDGNATGKDVLELVEHVKKVVKEAKDKDLELEIIILGEM